MARHEGQRLLIAGPFKRVETRDDFLSASSQEIAT